MDAAMNSVSQVVAEAMAKVRSETFETIFDKLVNFMENKIEMDEEMRSYFNAARTSIREEMEIEEKTGKGTAKVSKKVAAAEKKAAKVTKSVDDGDKKKRPLSMNNLFVQDKMAELKAAGVKSDPEKGNLLKQANAFWKALSDEDKATYADTNRERLDSLNRKRSGVTTATNNHDDSVEEDEE